MPDLTTDEVRSLLRALDMTPLDDVDLDEITNRVNAINEAAAALEDPEADAIEPVPVFWLTAEGTDAEEAGGGR
ncbi:MAG: hypothetical protein OXL97_05345 [Chloroflexota bacterium]|nr:hypothetical protein [Chloroflexota bacterium]MDE2883997.1 hypothetical protein [Chloroflexota bacterium]